MIGAVALIRTLVDAEVDVCFMNPGTSEMHFVHALDAVPEMRGVLTLFEGVATGAADGYARMSGRPAAVLLHLGPGLGNGIANLHNARRARSPMVVVVGGHATYHDRFDPPLESDIPALAGTVAGWVHTAGHQREIGTDAARAVAHAHELAVLVLPADVSWSDGADPAAPWAQVGPTPAPSTDEVPTGPDVVLFLGGRALSERGLRAADRIRTATGTRLLAECFPARLERGAGRPALDRIAYLAERVEPQLAGAVHLVLAGAPTPAAFFAYPGRPNDLVPEGCATSLLADPAQDVEAALEALADRVAPDTEPTAVLQELPDRPTGALGVRTTVEAIAFTLPEHAIVVDEAITAGDALARATATAAPHTVLTLTGGAIGQGLPAATGAALAAPDRPVLCVQADGSAMYTIQSLWTQAREQLDVTTVLLNNRSYAILGLELARVRAGEPGGRAADMLDLGRPDLDFTALARGMGVDAVRVTDAEALITALQRAYAEPGPHLIEAMLT